MRNDIGMDTDICPRVQSNIVIKFQIRSQSLEVEFAVVLTLEEA